jgi:hypothetical protein
MKLDDFRNEVEYNLTFGPLADEDLPVVNDDGESIVIVALAEERLSDLFRRVDAAGGLANVFVRDSGAVHLVTVLPSNASLSTDGAEDMTGRERPSLSSSVGVFVAYLRSCEAGLLLPAQMSAKARLDRDVELASV